MKPFIITLLCAAALFAQDISSKVIQLTHVNPDNTGAVLDVLSAGKVRWRVDPTLRVVVLNGPTELVNAMEAAVKKLDVPPPSARNIELTFHMLLAGPQGESSTVPADLSGVVQQLKTVFGLKSFRVLETAVIRGREAKPSESSGLMPPAAKVDASAQYVLKYQNILLSAGEKAPHIRIDNLRFETRLPVPNRDGSGYTYTNTNLVTDVDIREGQKVVVGKTSIDAASQSIFLVVTAKVVD